MRLTAQLAHGRRVAATLKTLADQGWHPDVVLVHPFWGDVLFLDDVYPDAPLVALLEIDFQGLPLQSFDPEFGCVTPEDFGANLALRQWADQLAMRRMEQGVTATAFQRSSFAGWQQSRIEVIHEGVDLACCRPDPLARLTLPSGLSLQRGDPVVTFGSRSLEPLRGLPTFLRSLPLLQRRQPAVQVVVVGQDGHSYGPPPLPVWRRGRSCCAGSWVSRWTGAASTSPAISPTASCCSCSRSARHMCISPIRTC